ncbi:Dyp-type peroxidase [Agromyces atrinae]|uniref:Dye decolorizing peroxidase n=1 Tax=Agromyces atrinae TaxID=592376 RepID=A0A4Q2M6Y2_9MICO|nr:Dyp-type peroxidase [Agromyces atrinae]NYD68160.1 dye decolorizing peroxidase [Agromyces atrinae]RXZ87698.1 Dyp-type peroxidase [Agromyces atrinae]
MTERTDTPRPSRRSVLLGAGAGLVAGIAGTVGANAVISAGGSGTAPATPTADIPPRGAAVTATGRTQAGIARPGTPQMNCLVAVFDLDLADDAVRGALPARLEALGAAILALSSPGAANPDGSGDLTVTVGLGPRVVAAIDPALPGALALPAFAGDDAIPARRNGGDLLLSLSATDGGLLHPVLDELVRALGDVSPRWRQRGFRAVGEGTIARNPLGYHDGIIVPHGRDELDENVWIADGPAAGGTVCVIRRLLLDTSGFGAEAPERRDAIIGRREGDGAPLSGGGLHDEANLLAKTPDGSFLVPARSHVRAAHPSFTGSALMLRRGYAFDDGETTDAAGAPIADSGLLFVCFQRDLDTFVKTQARLDETDDLMSFATPTASASFLILPGFDATRPLGSPLFA